MIDLLAHLIGWDYTNIEAIRSILSGQVPDFYAFYDEDWRTFNDRLVTKYKMNDFGHLVEEAKKSHQKLIKLLRSITAEEFYKDRGLRYDDFEVTLSDLLETELKDEKEHYWQVAGFGSEKNPPF